MFCVFVSRGCMPRTGWSSLPVPDGWFEVIRGPRPPSVQWPRQEKGKGKGAAPSPAPRGRWRNSVRGTSAVVQTRRDQPRLTPEEALTAPRERVQKLERALEVLGEDSGPEFQVLQNSLKKAKAAAQGVPVGVQLEQILKFVERSEKRLRVLDEERAKEARLLEEAQQRVARLRSELAAGPQHPPPTVPPD